ncbi:hypothetical protein EWM64_g2052 [Hericium alpestre]|uniref:BCS1 N-terminal domain-containing protein n=1 Tax=Hericium alpestre TaxID=135208 RepID=A0A4Z0A6H7_9AGAM|nr:hypothetical protein EWM64_g2052 [Hericium alpestre]
MASSVLQLAPLLQPLLAALKNGSLQLDNSSIPSNITLSQPGSFEMPTDVSSLISFIYSLGALRDWLKLIVFGGLIELCRRLYYHYYQTFIDQFFITANFESEDMAFSWMMHWLSTLPQWRKVRQFTVSTGNWGLDDKASVVLEDDDGNSEFINEGRRTYNRVNYLPSMSTSYSLWYKRRWITISHVKEESRWCSDKSTLTVTILSRDRSALDSLILEAKRSYIGALNDKIDIYVNDGFSGDWRHVASRPKRPLKSIILDAGVKELVLDDAKDFLRSKSWYADRGIPFRRGYLLHGAPGSGKTSIIHSLAGELGLNIYIISLSKTGLDDTALNNLICELPEQCIALMEDIDAAFTHGLIAK